MKNKLPEETIEFARSLRLHQTDAEHVIWSLLRGRRLAGYKFRRQHPVGNYILDFYCHEANLAIEIDGGQHTGQKAVHDAVRTAELERAGITVLRFWNHDVLQDPIAVCEAIFAALSEPLVPPSPLPLSQRERGGT